MGPKRRISLGWDLLAVLLIAAALSGGGITAFVSREFGSAGADPSVPPHSAKTKLLLLDHIESENSKFILRNPISVPFVAASDYDDALESMKLSPQERQELRNGIDAGRVKLLWLTVWDWDTQTENGDTISITADEYRRIFRLSSHRTRIAIPEPRSGTIELRGERSEDGIIAISFLSGNRPVALPRMTTGDSIELEIDPQ